MIVLYTEITEKEREREGIKGHFVIIMLNAIRYQIMREYAVIVLEGLYSPRRSKYVQPHI